MAVSARMLTTNQDVLFLMNPPLPFSAICETKFPLRNYRDRFSREKVFFIPHEAYMQSALQSTHATERVAEKKKWDKKWDNHKLRYLRASRPFLMSHSCMK
jgi:hypothetical protein